MAAQGLSRADIAEAFGIPGDELGLEQMPEMRVGRISNVLFSQAEQFLGLREGIHFPSLKRLSKKDAVLTAYAACGQITMACEAAKLQRTCHYRWLKKDPAYVIAFEEAHQLAGAVHGTVNTIFYEGQPVGIELKHSDAMLGKMLESRFPEEFGPKSKVEHSVSGRPLPDRIEIIVVRPGDAAAKDDSGVA